MPSRGHHVDVESTAPTYRGTFSFAGPAGDALELVGSASKVVKVRRIVIDRPSAETVAVFNKRSAADTGGTATAATVVPVDSGDPAGTAVLKRYTVAPTQGTLVGEVNRVTVGVTQTLFESFGDGTSKPLVLRGTAETLCVTLTVAATIRGMVEWTEE